MTNEPFQPGDTVRRTQEQSPWCGSQGMIQGRLYTVTDYSLTADAVKIAGNDAWWQRESFELVTRAKKPEPKKPVYPTTNGSILGSSIGSGVELHLINGEWVSPDNGNAVDPSRFIWGLKVLRDAGAERE